MLRAAALAWALAAITCAGPSGDRPRGGEGRDDGSPVNPENPAHEASRRDLDNDSCPVPLAAQALACPDRPVSPAAARAHLLGVDSPAAAAAALARGLADRVDPELRGHLRLLARAHPETPETPETAVAPAIIDAALADPLATAVTPVDDRVLAILGAAEARRFDRQTPAASRLRATTLLARAHHEALLQLGTEPPLSPLARALAGRFFRFGRGFVAGQRRRHLPGLDPLAETMESRLLEVLIAVEATPYAGDDALLFTERSEVRRLLLQGPLRRRLAATGRDPAGLLLPWTAELTRLIAGGFVDQATDLAFAYISIHGAPVVEAHLLAALRDAGDEGGRRRAIARMNDLHRRDPPPPREGESLPAAPPPPWPSPAAIATPHLDALDALDAPRRRQLLAAALLALRERPDAALWAVATIAAENQRPAQVAELDWLLPEIAAAAPLQGPRLRLAVAAARLRDPRGPRELRQGFALAAQEARDRVDAKASEQLLANRPQPPEVTPEEAEGREITPNP